VASELWAAQASRELPVRQWATAGLAAGNRKRNLPVTARTTSVIGKQGFRKNPQPTSGANASMFQWFRNIKDAVWTVLQGMWVTLRYWMITYKPERKTFTEHFEYPELPLAVAPRYRGFHRYDLTTCIACDQCAKVCPVDCIYIGKERVTGGGKGFKVTGFTIDYSKCMFCALCVEPCPVDCIFMGASHDLSCYSRDGCLVDFARLPVDVAWGRASLNPTAVAASKVVIDPVHGGPNQ